MGFFYLKKKGFIIIKVKIQNQEFDLTRQQATNLYNTLGSLIEYDSDKEVHYHYHMYYPNAFNTDSIYIK